MTEKADILVVDDDESFRLLIGTHLRKAGFAPLLADGGPAALHILGKRNVDIIISDQEMPGMDGTRLLAETRSKYSHIPFIMLTGHGDLKNAVQSIKRGAYDYIAKPYDKGALLAVINRALDFRRLRDGHKSLRERMGELYSFQNIITKSPALMDALKLAEKVAKSPGTAVAIQGESGTGKEVLARAIHYAGEKMENRFVAVNCAAIPAALLESELFGHTKGAFTGADREKEGKFGLARGGTILLDEISDMPAALQAKLLRVLQERVYEKLGSNESARADCRVIAATHRDLSALVKDGLFREDLYYRINAFPIFLPPLRQRKEDIPLLTEHFIGQFSRKLGKHITGISARAMDALLDYHWPGNIRELENCLERAAIVTEGGLIRPEHLVIKAPERQAGANAVRITVDIGSPGTSLEGIVNEVLQKTLEKCGGNKSRAAEVLKVDRKMFYRRG